MFTFKSPPGFIFKSPPTCFNLSLRDRQPTFHFPFFILLFPFYISNPAIIFLTFPFSIYKYLPFPFTKVDDVNLPLRANLHLVLHFPFTIFPFEIVDIYLSLRATYGYLYLLLRAHRITISILNCYKSVDMFCVPKSLPLRFTFTKAPSIVTLTRRQIVTSVEYILCLRCS